MSCPMGRPQSRNSVLTERSGLEAYLVPAPDPTSFARTLHWSGGFIFRSNGIYLNTISEFSPDGTLKSHDCADYFPMDSRLVSYLVMMIELAPTPPKGALVTATRLPSVMLMA